MNPFDTAGFPDRWSCGLAWYDQPWVGWLHIVSDIIIVMAYFDVPVVVMYFVRPRDDLKLPPVVFSGSWGSSSFPAAPCTSSRPESSGGRRPIQFGSVSSAEISQSTSIQSQLADQLRGRLTDFTILAKHCRV